MAHPMLTELNAQFDCARLELERAISDRFRPGKTVHVTWGNSSTEAEVIRTMHGRVEVRSIHGKTYQVDATRLVEFDIL